jgi:hypothetical protein
MDTYRCCAYAAFCPSGQLWSPQYEGGPPLAAKTIYYSVLKWECIKNGSKAMVIIIVSNNIVISEVNV